MDPALWELIETGEPSDEVSVILRLVDPAQVPDHVRVVSRFGHIITVRVERSLIRAVWDSDKVVSVKAARPLLWPSPIEDTEADDEGEAEGAATDFALPPDIVEDGTGVVVGICDWGFDFTHPNFRKPDGSTRVRALWDQRGKKGRSPDPFGYGVVHTRADIDRALAQRDPCRALNYHPALGDPGKNGSHGTHVADILAGNRREPGSVVGLASGADIVFVHLAPDRLAGLANFGDSVRLLEGLDFIRREAGNDPCVLHLSAGKTGGAKRGETPFEQAVDAMLLERPGIALVQSAGNYANSGMHSHVRLGPDQSHVLVWSVSRGDKTPNEMEIWYSGQDVFDLTLVAPNGAEFSVPLGERAKLEHDGADWGALYHRANEPNSGLNHIDIFLHTSAPYGHWRVALRGRAVVDGRMHAWIERDARGRHQSRFLRRQATSRYTTNTICNSFRAIAVGAYVASSPDRPTTVFSSRGPTADGRQKPELVAPGFRILAARSMPAGGWNGERRLTVKSGTSMAAPWVSGTVALMFQAAGRPLTINEVRSLLIGTADPPPGPGRSSTRLGYGYLNPAAAVAAARRIGADTPTVVMPVVPPAAQLHREDLDPSDDESPLDETALDESALDGSALDESALDEPVALEDLHEALDDLADGEW
jgi:subtilisin family serine protease